MRRMLIFALFACVLILAAPAYSQESSEAVCAPLVTQALEAIGSNCDSMGRNTACYGYNRVEATFSRVQAVEFFSQPADRALLTDFDSLQTSPLEPEVDEWGIAVLNLQANLPQFLPGESVIFLMIGDVSVEDESGIAPPPFPIVIATTETTEARALPSADALSFGEIVPPAQVSLLAKDANSEWVRADIGGVIGWLPVSAFDELQITTVLEQLPVAENDAPLPMQAFTFQSALNDQGFECDAAPPSLMLMQGPQGVEITFTVNGADVQIASTVVLYRVSENVLRLVTLDGTATLENGQTIPAGFAANAFLNEDGEIESWGETEPATQEELARLLPLEQIDNDPDDLNFLNYPIEIPDAGEGTPTPTTAPTRRPVTNVPRQSTATPTATPPPPPTAEPFVRFSVDNPTVIYPACTFARWETGNIDSVYFDGAPTVGTAEQQVCPQRSTTYGLLVRFRDGTERTYTATVDVIFPSATPEPPTPTPTPTTPILIIGDTLNICGNDLCSSSENMFTCPADCAVPVCGNLVCEPGEDPYACSTDCSAPICGNSICEIYEDACNCSADCGTCPG